MNVMKLFDLQGQVAVVTGADSGLGRQIAEAMAEAGADLVCADIDEAGNAATAEAVRALGRRALALRCDVSVERETMALFEAADREFGRVDIAFANAGMTDPDPQPLHTYRTDHWKRVMA